MNEVLEEVIKVQRIKPKDVVILIDNIMLDMKGILKRMDDSNKYKIVTVVECDDAVEIANVGDYTGSEKPCCIFIFSDYFGSGKKYIEGLSRSTTQLYGIIPPRNMHPFLASVPLPVIPAIKSAAEGNMCKLITLQLSPLITQKLTENHKKF